MKISLVQIEAIPGNIEKNAEKHLDFIERASLHHPDLIAFPELSLTGYEPKLATALAMDENDNRLEVFGMHSQRYGVSIALGLPLRSPEGIYIGMVIFHPDGKKQVYRKQMLHDDEKPFFIAGSEQVLIEIKELKVALAICYEAFQDAHLLGCLDRGADIYLATASKHFDGVRQAYGFIRGNAPKHGIPILMANSVGHCDHFLSAGGTSIWSAKGNLLQQLGYSEEGILHFEHEKRGKDSDLSALV
ncbi:MAG: carbon-nitrogen hydrolase family protein [Cryomorphaceae bacterium]